MEINKPYASDPFDYRLSVRGFNAQLTFMQSELYDYIFNWTFKRKYKAYAAEFEDQFQELSGDEDFFRRTEDPWVIHCVEVRHLILVCRDVISLRFGLETAVEMDTPRIVIESRRFEPFTLCYVYSKSYKKMKMYYERTLRSQIEYLYQFACVFTASKYRIPKVLKNRFNIEDPSSLDLLDSDNDTVAIIIELIQHLTPYLKQLEVLNAPKPPRVKIK